MAWAQLSFGRSSKVSLYSLLVSGCFFHDSSGLSWWAAVLIFFAPDLSFAGYLLNPKVGAFGYNLVHVYALGAICIAAGVALSLSVVGALGALWLAHSGFDRKLGYGLK